MSDWGPVFVAVVLFVVLTPGLLFKIPLSSEASRLVQLPSWFTPFFTLL
ncbi:hypothetical protein ABFX02_11G133550 [Erythranthe guttata]